MLVAAFLSCGAALLVSPIVQQHSTCVGARRSLSPLLSDSVTLPPALAKLGCDEELWSKIRAKKALISLVEAGDEAGARERLERLRNSPSITGYEAELPAELITWGYTAELWSKVKSKKPLVDLAAAGDEAEARTRLVKLEAVIAAEAETAAKKPPKAAPTPKAARAPKKAKPLSEGYTLRGALPDGFDAAPVEALLAQRVAAKLAKDYTLADQLQTDIASLGVFVNDRTRTWGTEEPKKRTASKGAMPKEYTLKGDLPAGFDAAPVEALLAQRVAAKVARDYALADQLQKDIVALGVYLDDKVRTWNVPKSATRY